LKLVKCRDCKNYEEPKCSVMGIVPAFRPDTEIVCLKFEPKPAEEEKPAEGR